MRVATTKDKQVVAWLNERRNYRTTAVMSNMTCTQFVSLLFCFWNKSKLLGAPNTTEFTHHQQSTAA